MGRIPSAHRRRKLRAGQKPRDGMEFHGHSRRHRKASRQPDRPQAGCRIRGLHRRPFVRHQFPIFASLVFPRRPRCAPTSCAAMRCPGQRDSDGLHDGWSPCNFDQPHGCPRRPGAWRTRPIRCPRPCGPKIRLSSRASGDVDGALRVRVDGKHAMALRREVGEVRSLEIAPVKNAIRAPGPHGPVMNQFDAEPNVVCFP